MFATIWRAHWGLQQDPFAGEDADKDTLLDEVDLSCVHSGFDRLFGSTKSPAPGVVFGEKGSGKSGLRRMMRRKLSKLEEERPEERPGCPSTVDGARIALADEARKRARVIDVRVRQHHGIDLSHIET